MMKTRKNKEKHEKSPADVSKKHRYTGYLLALLTAVCAALSYGFMKLYNGNRAKAVVARCVLQTLSVWPLINYKDVDVCATNLHTTALLIIRGLTSGGAVITLSLAVTYLPVGDVTAIFFSFPAIVGIFARICLKEHCGVLRIVITLITFVGLIFVAEPSFIFGKKSNDDQTQYGDLKWLGIILSFVSAVSNSADSIVIRKLGRDIHFSHSMLYFSVECLIMSLVYLASVDELQAPCLSAYPIITGASCFGLLAQVFFTMSLQRIKASPASLLVTTQVLFAFLLQYFFFNEVPSVYGAIGASLIFACSLATGFQAVFKANKTE